MLHILATLVTMVLLFGAGGVIAISLGDRRSAIAAALDRYRTEDRVAPATRRTRIRWSQVRSSAAPVGLARYVA